MVMFYCVYKLEVVSGMKINDFDVNCSKLNADLTSSLKIEKQKKWSRSLTKSILKKSS